ncbi:MAG: hypothetical protein CMJ33_10730 [Phycisphaerae bacterium]|nr:hypothetical protein [Phycisphaerae bacterium]HAW95825.1 hypothetical protein [Phycisphaerales bacterium]
MIPHVSIRVAVTSLSTFLGLVFLLTGCGQTSSGIRSTSQFQTEYRSINVLAFANATSDLKIAANLNEALVKEIETITPWKVTGHGRADTMLRGSITRFRLVLLSKDPTTGLANEMLVEATVDFEWINLRTGEPIVARNGFAASAMFTPSRPLQQPIDLGRFEIAQTLARDIVDTLQVDW